MLTGGDEPYDPWDDLGKRFPEVLLALKHVWPARAKWYPRSDVIHLHVGLSQSEARCAIAHEIAHMDLKHRPTRHSRFGRNQEQDADVLAARRLIRIGDLAETYVWTRDDAQMAEMLWVDIAAVHTRLGNLHPAERQYIEARMARVEHVA